MDERDVYDKSTTGIGIIYGNEPIYILRTVIKRASQSGLQI